MERYSLQFKKSVTKDLHSIPKKDVRRILKRIEALADDPHPSGCEKPTTRELDRIRQGCYCILYQIHDGLLVVMVITVAKRSDVYQ